MTKKVLPRRKHGALIPGPQAHAFVKHLLWRNRHGYVNLP